MYSGNFSRKIELNEKNEANNSAQLKQKLQMGIQKKKSVEKTQMTIVNGYNFSGAFSNKINTSSQRIYTLKNT